MPNIVLLAGGLVLVVCVAVVVGRTLNRPSRGHGEELRVSRAWLADNQSRNGSE